MNLPLVRIPPSLLSLLVIGALAGCADDEPLSSEPSAVVLPAVQPEVKQLVVSSAQADARASQLERDLAPKLADGIGIRLWASEALLEDPVALSMDNQGNAWVAVTNRSNNSEFDIRGWPHWHSDTLSFTSVDDRRTFLRDYFATEKNLDAESMPDRNGDGKHDWRDLTVAKEAIFKVFDGDGDGLADTSQVVLEDFSSLVSDVLGGVYYDNTSDSVYLTVAPNAWHAQDTSGDGYLDEKTSLAEGFGVHIGFSGHNMSGVTKGPDGRLYYGVGDIGATITDAAGKQYNHAHEGVIVRSEPDGSNFEIFATGLRNTHEFTFDKYGNLISSDNDGDHAGEFERLVYLIDGSDTGWRTHWQFGKYTDPQNNTYKVWTDEGYHKARFAEQSALILPPIKPFYSGPTGMVYNPGTALNEAWQDYFFLVQFTGTPGNSGINAFTLEPDGAGFKLGQDKPFMRGIQGTGLDVGPDGALYTADWVDGWQINDTGRIWRLDTDSPHAKRAETQQLLQQSFNRLSAEQLLTFLSHADQRVRTKAQFELVAQGDSQSLITALSSKHQLGRIHGVWGLGQLARQRPEVAEHLLPLLQDVDAEVRVQAAKVLGDTPYPAAERALRSNLKHPNARVQMFAAQALGRIGAVESFSAIVAMLQENNDRDVYLRQAGAIALARLGQEQKLIELAGHPSVAVRVAAVIALNRLASPGLATFLQDNNEYVVTNAARAINDDALILPALPALAGLLSSPPFTNEPLLRRAINANAFMADTQSAQRLVAFAADVSYPAVVRAEALNALSVWQAPSVYDRVSGIYRGERSSDTAEAIQALRPEYAALLAAQEPQVREAAANAVGRLGIRDAGQALSVLMQSDSQASVRRAALESLHRLTFEKLTAAVFLALKDDAEIVRRAALGLIPELTIAVSEKVQMYKMLLQKGTFGERQETYSSLAKIQAPEADELIVQRLQLLLAGDIDPEVQLELVQAASISQSAQVQTLLQTYQQSKPAGDTTAQYIETLKGGDAHMGRLFFFYNTTAQCVRCHVLGESGSPVGPELTDIGSRLTRYQLLEAMVAPGARVAPGFGRTTVTLKNGAVIEGHFSAEAHATVSVTTDTGQKKIIPREDIATQSFSGSGMPPMGLMLEKENVRDIVEFLASQKGQAKTVGH
ncbi:HEAT repeat domain-containing protein [Gilvimarinus polysaccharolyticus]|uniref:HEAT repeat domain-containing protein n=1 Tax=Gilvimarinus polysaccharolyticus TaxID=863921 RepID=UPI00067384A9|nr:HEAT repeat domain-containing protein [Gilvimarinus polysaccharolyticus]